VRLAASGVAVYRFDDIDTFITEPVVQLGLGAPVILDEACHPKCRRGKAQGRRVTRSDASGPEADIGQGVE
jgi:hypothetical protein